MASLRQIRRRLRSVQNTKQIMRAMQLVSGSKLKRSQLKLQQAQGVFAFLDGLLQRVLASLERVDHPTTQLSARRADVRLRRRDGWWDHPLCATHEGKPSALVIFTSDAGLCGSYNTHLIQLAGSYLRRDSLRKTHLIYIGKKAHRYLTKRGYAATQAYLDVAGRPNAKTAQAIGGALMDLFTSGQVGSVHLLYAHVLSSTASRPTIEPWLPIQLSPRSIVHSPQQEYIFEPSPQRVFEDLLPRWALAKFQVVMFEAFTAEHSARMMAMKNATDNAEELINTLTMQRNKVRQATITKEISEIVGAAEALK